MPAGEPEDPLRQQVLERVPDLAGLAVVDETPREVVNQALPSFGGFEQDRAAIRTGVRLIEGRDEGAVEEVGEQDSLWYRVGAQAKASVVKKSLCRNSFLTRGGFCVSTEIGPFMNFLG